MPREWIASSAWAIWPARRMRDARGDAFADAARERAGGQELHRDVGKVAGEALVVDARHERAVQARHQLVFAHEALEEHAVVAQRAFEHLERHAQPVVLALGEEHLRLSALPDNVDDVVARTGCGLAIGLFCHFIVVRSVRGDKSI